MREEPVYRGILGIDIQGFSRPAWTDPTRARLRGRLRRLVDQALARAEIERSRTSLVDTGDGLLLLTPAEVSTARLLHPLVTALATGLTSDNQQTPSAERMRLRAVVHAGEVLEDTHGHTGDSLNHAARLLDSPVGRAILAGVPGADLVLLVSEQVYQGVVRHAYTGIDPMGYQPVWAQHKKTSAPAWVHLPGESAQPDLARLPTVSTSSGPALEKLAEPPSSSDGQQLSFLDKPAPSTVFVGRESELSRLREAIAEASAGKGRLVLIGGEMGIGKSRTAREITDEARAAGIEVLWGRASEAEGAVPYWPWIQIMRAWLAVRTPEELKRLPERDLAVVAQLVPDLGDRQPGLPEPPHLEPAQARFRLFDAMTRLVKGTSREHTLVLIIDDLHRADIPSVRLLQFLVDEVADAHLLVIVTYRDARADLDDALVAALAEITREPVTKRLSLRGLSEPQVARFVRLTAGVEVAAPLVTKLHRRTSGNPLFLSHVIRPLVDDRDLDNFEQSLDEHAPAEMLEVVQWRLQRLPKEARDVLDAASVVGREFDLDVLETACDLHEQVLLELMERACAFDLIAEMPGAVGRYRFSHVIVRDAFYLKLSLSRRVHLHLKIGEALERVHAIDLQDHLPELAHHFMLALPRTTRAKGLAYLVQAGQRAVAVLAYEEGMRFFRMALAQLLDEQTRCEVLLALADAEMRAGDASAAQATYVEAARAARALKDSERLARAALGFGNEFSEFGLVNERLISLLQEALGVLATEDSMLRARLLGHLAVALYWMDAKRPEGSLERREELSNDAVDMARRIGDPSLLASVLDNRHYALWGPDNITERLAVADEIIKLAGISGDQEMALQGRRWRLINLLELGEVQRVDREIEAYEGVAEELRQPLYLFWPSLWRGMRAQMTGDFKSGERLAMQALALGERAQETAMIRNGVFSQLWFLRSEQGRPQDVEGAVKQFVKEFPGIPAWRLPLIHTHIAGGRRKDAIREFRWFAEQGAAAIRRDAIFLATASLLAEISAMLGDRAYATELYPTLLPYRDRFVAVGFATVCYGSVAQYLGQLAAAMGESEIAREHLEAAIAANRRIDALPHVADSMYNLADVLLSKFSSTEHKRARELLLDALIIAKDLGMQSLRRAISLKLRTHGFDARGRR